jgi:integrase
VAAEARKFYASALLDEFLQDKLKSTAPSYHSGYKKQVERAKLYFGNSDVREIRKDDIIRYLAFLKKEKKAKNVPLKSKTILNNFANFKTFINYLKEEMQIISTAPDFPTEKEIERRMEEIVLNEKPFNYASFNPEDQMRILDVIENNKDRNIIRFLMLHGCRPGEARALRVADVNIAALSITIKSTYSKNTLRQRRKGKKSKPYAIAIHPEMVDFFRKRVKNHPEAFVFVSSKTGAPYMIDAFQDIFASVRKKLNIPREVRLYDASRHSFVTQLRRAGTPLSEISKLVGHSSEKMTENVYNHADDIEIENKRIAISRLSLEKPAVVVNIRAAKRKSSTDRQQ